MFKSLKNYNNSSFLFIKEKSRCILFYLILIVMPLFMVYGSVKYSYSYYSGLNLIIDINNTNKNIMTPVLKELIKVITIPVLLVILSFSKTVSQILKKAFYKYSLTTREKDVSKVVKIYLNFLRYYFLCIILVVSLIFAILLITITYKNTANIKSFDQSTSTNSLNEEELRVVAVHESGHFILNIVEYSDDNFVHIKIPTKIEKDSLEHNFNTPSSTLGYNLHQNRSVQTPEDLLKQMRISLAGYAAIIVLLEKPYTGAGSDINNVYSLVQQYVNNGFSRFGLTPWVALTNNQQNELYTSMMNEQYSKTIRILSDNKNKIYKLSKELIKKMELSNAEARKIIGK